MKRYNNFKKVLFTILIIFSSLLIVSCNNSNEVSSLDNSSTIVFKNVSVIPMDTETILKDYNVVIKDEKIVELGKSRKTKIPKNAKVINGKGKYLTPGLADMHVHFWKKDELTLYLANGVTTIRDMFGSPYNLMVREQIEQEKILGPRLYASTPIMDGESPVWQGSTVVKTPEEAEEYVIMYKEMGYDFVKVYEKLTNDVYDSIIKTAKEQDIPVVGHVPGLVGIEKVLQSGQKSIEHLDNYYDSEDLYDMTVENNVWNCPTLVVYQVYEKASIKGSLEGKEYINPNTIKYWEEVVGPPEVGLGVNRIEFNNKKRIVKKLYDKGGKIILGTDTNNPFILPGFSIHDELYNLVDAGFTPYEAIRTGTYNAAEFLDALDESGTVEIGKNADLILLAANPLEDITNMKAIEGVMVRGKWISKSEMDKMLETIAEKYKTVKE